MPYGVAIKRLDWSGQLVTLSPIYAGYKHFDQAWPIKALEGDAYQSGMIGSTSFQRGVKPSSMGGLDMVVIIHVLTKSPRNLTKTKNVLENLLENANRLEDIVFVHCKRECNFVTHPLVVVLFLVLMSSSLLLRIILGRSLGILINRVGCSLLLMRTLLVVICVSIHTHTHL